MQSQAKQQALDVLKQNEMEIERLLILLSETPNKVMTFQVKEDEDEEEWAFTLRRRSRLFLMAKNNFMKKYEEIAVTSK
jgi:hypothetical protein